MTREPDRPPPAVPHRGVARGDDEPVLPTRSSDETDLGWAEQDGDGDERLLRERPPHW